MIGVLVMINNFFHDFSVALLACALLGLAAIWRAAPGIDAGGRPLLRALDRLGVRIAWASFGGVILFGIGRTLAFVDYEWLPSVGRGLLPALAVKHALLASLLAAAAVAALRARRSAAPRPSSGK